jgi:hypothetical protein
MNEVSRRTILGAPYLALVSKAAAAGDGRIVGHGTHRYRVDTKWCQAKPETHPVNDCHEMVQARDGRLFLFTNHKQNNVLVLDQRGRVIDAWTLGWAGAHGLTIHADAEGREHLYATDTSSGRVVKTTLAGDVVMELAHPASIGVYSDKDVYSPTETAVGPNGDIYVADGYGSQFLLRYDKDGKFLNKFGGKSSQPISKGKFLQAHGVAIDARGEQPLVMATARIRNEFHWFTLEGEFVKTVYLPGAYMSRPVIVGENVYSGVCFGMFADDYRMWQGRGFVTILDRNNRVISNPGGRKPEYRDGRLQLMLQDEPVFHNCHDVCVDQQGDLYVCQWNSGKVYPYKLHREG